MIVACLSAMLVNVTPYPFTERDFGTLLRAQTVCEERYKGCVSNFTKVQKHGFRITCGDKTKFYREEYDKQVRQQIMSELKGQGLNEEQMKKALERIDL